MSEYGEFYQQHVEREILSALLDGELDADHRRYVHEHLQVCIACREAADEFGTIKGMVGELPRLIAPESFVSRALEPKRSSGGRAVAAALLRGRRKWIAASVAAVAAGITGAGLLVPSPAHKPAVDVFIARHVGVHDATDAGGQVLFAVDPR